MSFGLENFDWTSFITRDMPEVGPITDETVAVTKAAACSGRYSGCNARVAMGRIYTTKEYEAWRKEVLSRPLP